MMQSAGVGDVLLFSGRRRSNSSVGWVVNAVGTGQDGADGETADVVGGGRVETEDEGEDKLGCKRVCLCCLGL